MSDPFVPVKTAETWAINGTQSVGGVHLETDCEPPCTIHSPSDHHMRAFRLVWRDDRSIFERICDHGIGHPDPDMMNHLSKHRDEEWVWAQGLHGCDGCCRIAGLED